MNKKTSESHYAELYAKRETFSFFIGSLFAVSFIVIIGLVVWSVTQ